MKEDIQFLKELQQELLTQEHDSQVEPRFWVLRDYKEVVANEDYDFDRISYFHSDGDYTEFRSFEDLKKFIEDYHLEDELEYEDDTDELNTLLENRDFEELWDFIRDRLNKDGYFREVPVKKVAFIVPNTMFLTKAEAKRHIELNHYHYTSRVHTYAMTAWRAPKVEKLLKILETFDWNLLEETNIKMDKCDFCNTNFNKGYEFECPICNTPSKS